MTLQLIVGLGNSGSQYEHTRHNAGFWFVDALANRLGAEFHADTRSRSQLAKVSWPDTTLWLLKPQQLMNRSGEATQAIASFYKIAPESMLIAHDELDIAPGALRLKFAGGAGGHNGLRDIAARVDKQHWRLRIGIGHPGHRDAVTPYVLSKPPVAERQAIEKAIDCVLDDLDDLIDGNMTKLMNHLHNR